MKYKIFNHSSESMSEIDEESIDLVITDPPWNMGVKFGEKIDLQPLHDYRQFISNVIFNLFRVLKNEGLCVIICAEQIKYKNNIIYLENIYSKLFSKNGFFLIDSYPIKFEEDENSEYNSIPINELISKKSPSSAYSNEAKILIYSKDKKLKPKNTDIFNEKVYFFKSQEGHPCPSSQHLLSDILNSFFKEEMKVLDPFMGTANLGVEVLKRNGIFYGYEIVEEFYNTAKRKLDLI